MSNLLIKETEINQEKQALDQLLFDVLWKPLDMKRDARENFKQDKPEEELIAIDNGKIVGGIVANWLTDDEIEIHHMAVVPEFQGRYIGKQLFLKLRELATSKGVHKMSVYARNNSIAFYEKLGFKQSGEIIKQCDLIKHGITCHKMMLESIEILY